MKRWLLFFYMNLPDVSTFGSLPDLFCAQAGCRAESILFSRRRGSKLDQCTWIDADRRVQRIATGLIRLGLQQG
ncbi:MAG: hypothetical protein KJ645_13510, partial [Planctomycetes bacterium]|nr:hypothetical protein [Planctomycetota bacterium]